MNSNSNGCVYCRRHLTPGDVVVVRSDGFYHPDCRPPLGEAAAQVLRFLTAHANAAFCPTCLGLALDVDFSVVRQAIAELRDGKDVTVTSGGCARCSGAALSVQAASLPSAA